MNGTQAILIKKYIEGAFPFEKEKVGADAVFIEALNDYQYEGIMKSLKDYIQSGKPYAPSISILIKGYDIQLTPEQDYIFQLMDADDVFMDEQGDLEMRLWNYENRKKKAKKYLSSGIMPEWFRELLEHYRMIMISDHNIKRLEA